MVQTLYVRTYHTLYITHDRSAIPIRTTGERAVQSNHQPATQISLRFKRRVAVDLAKLYLTIYRIYLFDCLDCLHNTAPLVKVERYVLRVQSPNQTNQIDLRFRDLYLQNPPAKLSESLTSWSLVHTCI